MAEDAVSTIRTYNFLFSRTSHGSRLVESITRRKRDADYREKKFRFIDFKRTLELYFAMQRYQHLFTSTLFQII